MNTSTNVKPSLDRWLRAYAVRSQPRDVARTFIAADPELRVAGSYPLVAGPVEHTGAPKSVTRGISGHFPIPVCLIARWAVDRRWPGRGIGSGASRRHAPHARRR